MLTFEAVQQFAHLIVKDPEVAKVLEDNFGDKAELIKARLLTKLPIGELEDEVIDTLQDLVLNNGKTYSQFLGKGSYGEYPIDVRGIGEAYWVEAQDHDDEGFFDSIEDAEEYVRSNWNDSLKSFKSRRVSEPFGKEKTKANKK